MTRKITSENYLLRELKKITKNYTGRINYIGQIRFVADTLGFYKCPLNIFCQEKYNMSNGNSTNYFRTKIATKLVTNIVNAADNPNPSKLRLKLLKACNIK